MKIVRTYPFWTWLLRFAYRRVKSSNKMGVGIPGNRDPENPCPSYAPRKRLPGDGPAECRSDGHYLCKECVFYTDKPQTCWCGNDCENNCPLGD